MQLKLYGMFKKKPIGCMCESPNNQFQAYDERGYVLPLSVHILNGSIIGFNNGASAWHFDVNYCPLCGKKVGD